LSYGYRLEPSGHAKASAHCQAEPPARAASRDRIGSKQPFGRSRAVAAA
jgi:hypothetical protein